MPRPLRQGRGDQPVLTAEELAARHPWRPIRGCPGRFVVADPALDRLPPEQAFGLDDVRAHTIPTARDRVLVARLADGGVITYARADGTYLHTLATAEGFARKLAALGIDSCAKIP